MRFYALSASPRLGSLLRQGPGQTSLAKGMSCPPSRRAKGSSLREGQPPIQLLRTRRTDGTRTTCCHLEWGSLWSRAVGASDFRLPSALSGAMMSPNRLQYTVQSLATDSNCLLPHFLEDVMSLPRSIRYISSRVVALAPAPPNGRRFAPPVDDERYGYLVPVP